MQSPQQIIKETIDEICEKSRIGKKAQSTINENIKLMMGLSPEQQKIIDDISKLIIEGTVKKNIVEQLKELNKELETKIINTSITKQYVHIDDSVWWIHS